MKKLMFFAAALLFSVGVSAQETKTTTEANMTMKDGKVWVWENNMKSELTSDRTLPDGTKISATGVVTSPAGTTTTMVEGDVLDLNTVAIRKSSMKPKDAKKTK